jgi:hypothetical protein
VEYRVENRDRACPMKYRQLVFPNIVSWSDAVPPFVKLDLGEIAPRKPGCRDAKRPCSGKSLECPTPAHGVFVGCCKSLAAVVAVSGRALEASKSLNVSGFVQADRAKDLQ